VLDGFPDNMSPPGSEPAYEKPPPGKKVQLNLRVPKELFARLEKLQEGLRIMAELKGDPTESVDRTWAAIRALTVGIAECERQLVGDKGILPPLEDEKAWAKVRTVMAAALNTAPDSIKR
jgi:hypothetical protein